MKNEVSSEKSKKYMFAKIFFTPLEQFEIFVNYVLMTMSKVEKVDEPLSAFSLNQWEVTITNLHQIAAAILLIGMFSFHIAFFDKKIIARSWQSSVNVYLTTIDRITNDLTGHPQSRVYYSTFLIFIFLLINILNVFGLIPYTFVLTSQFFFTFSLAFLFFASLNLTGIIKHGFAFLQLFYPSGTPIFIVPLLVLIEFVSYIARVFSLAIRLFANITAGHILVKILSWLTWMILDFLILSSISFIIISSLWILEFFISILQAYVFLTSLCLYLNDVLLLH